MKIVIGVMVIALSINYGCTSSSGQSDVLIPPSETLIIDTPKLNPYTYINTKYGIADSLGIDDITQGFSGQQFRLWYDHSFTDTIKLLTFKNDGSQWKASIDFFKLNSNKTKDTLLSVAKTSTSVEPKSGWEKVVDKFKELKIAELPDYQSIEGYGKGLGSDGDLVTIELASKNKYRVYSYPSPGSDYWQSKNVAELLTFLNKEFDFQTGH